VSSEKKVKDLDWKKHLCEEGEHQDDVGLHGEGGLKSHYRKVIVEWLTSDKIPVLPRGL